MGQTDMPRTDVPRIETTQTEMPHTEMPRTNRSRSNVPRTLINRRRFLSAGAASFAAIPLAAAAVPQQFETSHPKIKRDRQTALDLLSPSASELQRGLELHTDAIVFDSYGFAPRAAVDAAVLNKATNLGATHIELEDLREEMTMTRMVRDDEERAEFEEVFRASGVTCVFQNCGEEGQAPDMLIKRLARFTFATDMMPEFWSKAVKPGDVERAKKQGRRALYFSGNGVPLTQQWASVADELRYVRIFFQLGIRMMHLTYNRRNMIGDGCAEEANGGLSDFGRAAIAEMNKIGVIPDVAHSGWQTSLEAARVSQKPVVASHSGAAAVNRHVRTKPDEVIRAIADSGGYVGVCCIPPFLGKGGDINALLDHVDHIAKKFGSGHVTIGTDTAYISRYQDRESAKFTPRGTNRVRFAALWPDDAFEGYPRRDPSLAWSNWPLFTVGLVQRGYSDEDIRKILGGNVLRVAKATMPPDLA